MKIWYDACTGKHIRYGTAIASRFRKSGHEVIFTTREHPDTVALANVLGENPIVVGKYDPSSLFSRLEESANRVIQFSRLFKDNLPDIAIAHQSVELCRAAFGFGIPIVLTADTPYANSVNRLTIPFADRLVVSESIPGRILRNYCARNIVRFKGVDEAAWIKGFTPSRTAVLKKPLIIVRETENKAAYAAQKNDLTGEIIRKLKPLGNVFVIQRYNKTGKEFGLRQKLLDSATLVADADLVVSAGGTIAREAALQGIPSIVISELGKTYVNEYLASKGFPLFITKTERLLTYAKKYIGKRFDVKAKLAAFENPVDFIEKAVIDIQHSNVNS